MDIETEKITIRIPKRYLRAIDFLVKADDFTSRSEAIRASIRDMVYDRIEMVPDKLKKLQEAEVAVQELEKFEETYLKK